MTINLGQKVKDRITGMEGIATGRSEYLNGCIRILVQPQALKDGVSVEAQWVDEPQLVIVEDTAVEQAKPTGGPRPDALRAPDPTRR
jgi:hypothetical protein